MHVATSLAIFDCSCDVDEVGIYWMQEVPINLPFRTFQLCFEDPGDMMKYRAQAIHMIYPQIQTLYWFFAAERTCSSWWQMHVLRRSIVSPMFHSVTVHDAYRRLEDLPISLRLGVFCFWLQQGQRVTQVLLPFSTWTCLVSLWFLCCWLLHPQECSVASAGHSFIP